MSLLNSIVNNPIKLLIILIIFLFAFLNYTTVVKNASNSTAVAEVHQDYAEKLVLEHFAKHTEERRKLIDAIVQIAPKNADDFINLHYALQVPEVRCVNLARLGSVVDGGKLICNPAKAKEVKNCVVYSFGINTDISFEQDFHWISGGNCKIHAIDNMQLREDIVNGLHGIGADILQTLVENQTTVNTTSFRDIVNRHGDKMIEILKMDIEGYEDKVFDQIFEYSICQILIEIHTNDVYRVVQMLKKFSAHGFWLYANEKHPTIWHISEYSFIHKNCMERYDVHTILGKYIV